MVQTVAILGASSKPARYSYLAFKMLQQYGHRPVPVSPHLKVLEGTPVFSTLAEVGGPIDTLTMYVGPEISTKLRNDILQLKPSRVIFNPGSENPTLETELKKVGIEVLEACTLVLLRTGQFEKSF
jgi:predicted CoA-binding protein